MTLRITTLHQPDTLRDYATFAVTVANGVAQVQINRPKKANALDLTAWQELYEIFTVLDGLPEVRAIVLSGAGTHFCAGIDLALLMAVRQAAENPCEGRMREKIRHFVHQLQAPINAVEQCRKPVLAAIQGACVGAGVDLVTACDMRYASADAFFSVAEIDMGMVADLGTLQRLPRLVGEGLAREMAYTGRRVSADEALAGRLVNAVWPDHESAVATATETARVIATKSPLAIRGSKQVITYARDHTVADSLEQIATWNAAMLLSNDLNEAFMAKMERRPPLFDN
jgi:enoyl-CoA hydratase